MKYRHIKRVIDIACALIGIVGTCPIWFISIILILLCDYGPVFYYANRVGTENRVFKMWKFRSMRVLRTPMEGTETSLRPEQSRIFWWGSIMRKLKIDELPQLLNILNGTMSIVGPRPASVDQVAITRGGVNACVSKLPCGLTSPSSLYDYVYGDKFPDEAEYNEKVLPTRLELDVWYVSKINQSNGLQAFCLDAKLVIWTVLAVISTLLGHYPKWLYDELVSLVKPSKYTSGSQS